LSFNKEVVKDGKIENVVDEVFNLTKDKKILYFEKWVCKNKEGLQYNNNMEIGKTLLIYCYEK